MNVWQKLDRFISPSCSDCPYHLGVVYCVVSPCPLCRKTGRRPSFGESRSRDDRSRRRDNGEKDKECMK